MINNDFSSMQMTISNFISFKGNSTWHTTPVFQCEFMYLFFGVASPFVNFIKENPGKR